MPHKFPLIAGCLLLKARHVLLKLDNTTAAAYINKKGGPFQSLVTKLDKDICNWAKGKDVWIGTSYVPGNKNINY